jgi:hypothetical protein
MFPVSSPPVGFWRRFVLADLSTYTVLKDVPRHSAVTWVGGAFALQIVATRVQRERDPRRLAEMAGISSSSARGCSRRPRWCSWFSARGWS